MKFKLLLACSLTLLFLQCKKEDKPKAEAPEVEAPAVEITIIPNTHASLQATYVSTILSQGLIGTYTHFEGIAHAQFFDFSGNSVLPKSLVCEGYTLEESGKGLRSAAKNDQGIDFGSTVSWQILGKDDIPDYAKDVLNKVPEIGDINIRDTLFTKDTTWLKINLKNPFSNLGSVDSVKFTVKGVNREMVFSLTNPADSIALSPNLSKSLGKGKIYITVETFRIEVSDVQNYRFAFINKGMFYKPLWLY